MPFHPQKVLDRLANRRAGKFWTNLARKSDGMDLETLNELRSNAQGFKRKVNQFLNKADSRLALPRLGSNAMNRPAGSDWVWRPELWRGPVEPGGFAAPRRHINFGRQAELYHDCKLREITIRQQRNSRRSDLAPFGVSLDVLGFAGSYLSLVINLPEDAVKGLSRRHILRVDALAEYDRPCTIHTRLNIQHGPNKEEIAVELERSERISFAEFDLGFMNVNEKRVEKLWCEFFFEAPEMNRVVFRDMIISRRPRAEI